MLHAIQIGVNNVTRTVFLGPMDHVWLNFLKFACAFKMGVSPIILCVMY